MPLDPVSLAIGLRQNWLEAEFPSSVQASADRFAEVVASWFAAGAAAGFPCTTAQARKSGLATNAGSALADGDPRGAGQQLALAVAQYMAGQAFGAGVSALPIAAPALVLALGEVFATHALDASARATVIAGATYATALSTIVTFPPPLVPSPVI